MNKKLKTGPQKHQPRKRFGQNFLRDDMVIDRIVNAINPKLTDTMIEIGPGLGALTTKLVDRVGHLGVVELDRDLIPHLKISFATRTNFSIFEGDALKTDYADLLNQLNGESLRIVGNLPYNISTPLLFHLAEFSPLIQDMYFMLQKEVVERMAADTGDSAYGRLSIMIQYFCTVEPLFLVAPESFNPPPKVESAIVKLTPHKLLPVTTKDVKHLGKIVTTAFSQRRKTVRNALRSMVTEALFHEAGIEPDWRPEQISLTQYAALADLTLAESAGAK